MTTRPAGRTARRLLPLLALTGALLAGTATTARAATVTGTGTVLSFSGNDYISAGQAWSYTPADATINATVSDDRSAVSVFLQGANLTFWSLELAAPTGRTLTAGTTYQAERFRGTTAGRLDLFGDGRGCNEVTGEFTVLAAAFGPNGWIEDFHATFTEHCEGNPDAVVFGEVRLTNGPAPAVLKAKVTPFLNAKVVRASGRAVITGSVTCNRPGTVTLVGELAQRRTRTTLATGTWTLAPIACGPKPVRWTASVKPVGGVPFGIGKAEVTGDWAASDDVFGIQVGGGFARVVTLAA